MTTSLPYRIDKTIRYEDKPDFTYTIARFRWHESAELHLWLVYGSKWPDLGYSIVTETDA